MREILFRGKRTDNYQWIKGYFVEIRQGSELIPHIIPFDSLAQNLSVCPRYRVFCETVEQYTGFTDKNSKKIFEGDIVKWIISWKHELNGMIENKGIDQVVYKNNGFELKNEDPFLLLYGEEGFTLEVIGNIHDNPELLSEVQK